ncbi:MAG TPA: caspase family protein [Xanthobacteraceae bacterium]|nr:caspase family protein [Xanthobacteraceae bacterium]
MLRLIGIVLSLLLLAPGIAGAQGNPNEEKRIALVIGNAGYQAGALATTANDAGLIAQTLQAAGFDVAGARDLDQDSLRRALRDFVDKATASGPNTVAYLYFAGYGLQLEGENYIVPIDAKIARDSDIPIEAVRVSDYTRPLAALKLKATIVVLDAARDNPFAKAGQPVAGGLALVEPEAGTLVAFNAAPGTIAPEGPGPYGPYAQALAEMMREGGLSLPELFDRVRLRVNDMTKGGQLPWFAGQNAGNFVFFERAPDAPPPAVSPDQFAAAQQKPIRDFDARDAFIAALERDTLQGYLDFLAAYPNDPMAKRVRAIVAARREAITWRRTRADDTPPAYWSYLRRYPNGPHAGDAERRLAFLSAALQPPPSFAVIAYDVPPPPPDEIVFVERPVMMFYDPLYAFAPPPPPPVFFLPPPPPDFVVLPPPPPVIGLFVLPMPVYRPVPIWVRPPAYIAPPPPNNVIFANVHNTVVINAATNTVTVTNPAGQQRVVTPPPGALGPSLPPSVATRAAVAPTQTPPGGPRPPITGAQPQIQLQKNAPLGQPLPKGPAPATATAPSNVTPQNATPPQGIKKELRKGPTPPGTATTTPNVQKGPAAKQQQQGAPSTTTKQTLQTPPQKEQKARTTPPGPPPAATKAPPPPSRVASPPPAQKPASPPPQATKPPPPKQQAAKRPPCGGKGQPACPK